MAFWSRLFGKKAAPPAEDARVERFLLGWDYELRSRSKSGREVIDELLERYLEHFPDAAALSDEACFARLDPLMNERTLPLIDAQKQREASWADATDNDRLSAAFAALREQHLVAIEDAGLTIQDGWGQVGLAQRAAHRGAVFFHQQDVLHALRGEGLLLAFGAFEERPDAPAHEAVGREVVAMLARFGLSTRWSGEASERILVTPFEWRKRVWTESPPVEEGDHPAPPLVPLDAAARHTPSIAFEPKTVLAHRSSAGFNLPLTDALEAQWKRHGGVRGQMQHLGPPHLFVRAGETTEVGVRNAYTNLPPAEASAPRRKARGIVIHEERAAVIRSTPWPRPLCSEAGGVGRIGLLVVSTAPLREVAPDDLPVDLPNWSPYAEVPETFTWNYRTRASDPERFDALPELARGGDEALLTLLARTRFGAFIHAEVPDARDLGHAQFGWAVAQWLLQGEGAVFDTFSQQWFTREALAKWEAGGWPTGRRFQLEREVALSQSPDEHGQWVIATLGLEKFGRSDFLLRVPAEQRSADRATIPGWAEETVRHFATQLALGATQPDGETLRLGSMAFTFEAVRPGENAPREVASGFRVLRRVS